MYKRQQGETCERERCSKQPLQISGIQKPKGADPFSPGGEVEDYKVLVEEDPTGTPDQSVPKEFGLHQSAPNPFNPATTIRYDLPVATRVSLSVYSIDGRKVAVLVDGHLPAGRHEVIWDGRDRFGQRVASGTYFYRIEAGDFRRTRRLALVK